MDTNEMERAYQTQPVFHSLVDSMFYSLMKGDISIYELRDACTLAMNKFADHKPPEPIVIPKIDPNSPLYKEMIRASYEACCIERGIPTGDMEESDKEQP